MQQQRAYFGLLFRQLPRATALWLRLSACLWAVALASSAFAQTPPAPTTLQVSDDGKEIRILGEPAPQPKAKLPLPKVVRIAADKPVVAPQVKQEQVVVPQVPKAPREPVRSAIEVSAGYTWMPNAIFRVAQSLSTSSSGRRDQHPDLQGFAIDGGYRMALGETAWVVFRGGLTIPLMPDQNWWSSTGSPAPLYTAINLAVIDLGADYLRRIPLTSSLGWTLRGGIGLSILAGDVQQIETLPNCTLAQAPSCAHWRVVGRSSPGIPPVLPALRAMTGLDWRVTRELSLGVEGGLRSVPYVGGTIGYQF